MSVLVVVLLEVIDVDVDASPHCIFTSSCGVESSQMPPVVASREWIADALLDELSLQLLSSGNVHEDPVENRFSGFRIDIVVPRIQHCPYTAVGTGYPELTVAQRSFTLE